MKIQKNLENENKNLEKNTSENELSVKKDKQLKKVKQDNIDKVYVNTTKISEKISNEELEE